MELVSSDKPAIIAVDGPAGSGKSSLCQKICTLKHWSYVNTGALYRGVAYLAKQEQVPINGEDLVVVAENFAEGCRWDSDEGRLFYRGLELNALLNTLELGELASGVAKNPFVRKILMPLQRQLAFGAKKAALLDGRDIGTVIFPDADLKIYLTASLEERAKRRLLQVSNSESQTESLERLKLEIAKRDEQDSNRTTAPLCRASDAILVDTTELDVEQSLQRLSEIICQRLPHIC